MPTPPPCLLLGPLASKRPLCLPLSDQPAAHLVGVATAQLANTRRTRCRAHQDDDGGGDDNNNNHHHNNNDESLPARRVYTAQHASGVLQTGVS